MSHGTLLYDIPFMSNSIEFSAVLGFSFLFTYINIILQVWK